MFVWLFLNVSDCHCVGVGRTEVFSLIEVRAV